MKMRFKQAAHFAGRDYQVGVHDISEGVSGHEFFKHLVKCGLIVDAEGFVPPLSLEDHNKALEKKFSSEAEPEPKLEDSAEETSDMSNDGTKFKKKKGK